MQCGSAMWVRHVGQAYGPGMKARHVGQELSASPRGQRQPPLPMRAHPAAATYRMARLVRLAKSLGIGPARFVPLSRTSVSWTSAPRPEGIGPEQVWVIRWARQDVRATPNSSWTPDASPRGSLTTRKIIVYQPRTCNTRPRPGTPRHACAHRHPMFSQSSCQSSLSSAPKNG